MKTKRITALLMAVTLTAALSACGSESKNASSVTASKRKESDTSKTTTAVKHGTEAVTMPAVSMTEEATGESTDVVAQAEPSSELNKTATPDKTSEPSKTAEPDKSVPDSSKSSKPNPNDSGSGTPVSNKSKSNDSDSGTPVANKSTPAPAQVNTQNTHTHSWKEHTATKQVWVPNIVTVDDYEDKVTEIPVAECDCGMKFRGKGLGDNPSVISEHMETNLLEAQRNGTLDECLCGAYMVYAEYETERVKVGSHEEDHGHYENSTYVDYYYCDCGARK